MKEVKLAVVTFVCLLGAIAGINFVWDTAWSAGYAACVQDNIENGPSTDKSKITERIPLDDPSLTKDSNGLYVRPMDTN